MEEVVFESSKTMELRDTSLQPTTRFIWNVISLFLKTKDYIVKLKRLLVTGTVILSYY